MNKKQKKVLTKTGTLYIVYIDDVTCKHCGKKLGVKQENSFIEIKCPRCKYVNEFFD